VLALFALSSFSLPSRQEIASTERHLTDLLPHYRRLIGDTTLTYKTVSGLTHLLEVTPRNFARVPTAGGGASSSSSSLPFFSSSSSSSASASASASASTVAAAAAAASDEWVLINQTQKARRYQPRAVAAAVAHRQQLRYDGRNELKTRFQQ
jgi:hypothetical protein